MSQGYNLDGTNCKLGCKWVAGTMWKASQLNRLNVVFNYAVQRRVEWERKSNVKTTYEGLF